MARPQTASQGMILNAANRVLERGGMDAFSLAAVAREVGLTRTAIALRFDNARKLKLQVLEARSGRFAEAMHALELERSGAGLLMLARTIGGMARSPRDLLAFMATSQANVLDVDLAELEHRRGAILRAAIARGMPEGLPDGAVDMFAAHLTGSLIAWSVSGEPSGEEFLAERTKVWLLMTGIAFDEEDA